MIGEVGIRRSVLALMLAGTGACAPSYDTLEVRVVQGSVDAEASDRGFSVPEGTLLVFDARPESSRGRDYEVFDTLELVSEAPEVARVEQGIAVGTWMIMGTAKGSTTIEVWVEGALEDRMPVDVTAQEVAP